MNRVGGGVYFQWRRTCLNAERNINNLRCTDGTILMTESKDKLRSLLMKVKEESGKVSLKLNIQKTKIMTSDPITAWQIDGEKMKPVTDFIFFIIFIFFLLFSKISVDSDCIHEIKRCFLLGRKAMTNLRQHIKKQRHYFADKGEDSQNYGFSSSHVWMWELDHKEGWVLRNWCFWTVVLEKTLESPLDCKEIKPVNPKGYQHWILIGRIDAEAETLILWPPDAKSQLIGKYPYAGKDWRQEKKGATEHEMVGWHHWFSGHEFEQTPGDGEGQGSLACCSWGGRRELDTTEWLNHNNNMLSCI